MHAPAPAQPPRSRELERRLHARARRTRVLRRRVSALTVALLLAFWGAVYAAGSLGSARSTVATAASADSSDSAPISSSSTDSTASTNSPTAVTTQQS